MQNTLYLADYISPLDQLEQINLSLHHIQNQLLQELSYKQNLVETKDKVIQEMEAVLEEKIKLIGELHEKILTIEKNNEGNKQLNKKLVSEIVRKQQDIEWYKRTYESRSFLGTLKQKLFKSFR